MTVRLGFAVAAFLDPEILVVDEVLAVGDAEFQKKAIGNMQDVSRGEGKTVLFVSHNMGSIDALCKRALVMKDGMMVFDGTQKEGISFYLQNEVANISNFREWNEVDAPGDERAKILKLEVTCPAGFNEINFSSGIIIKATIKSNINDQALDFSFNVKTEKEELLFHHGSLLTDKKDLGQGLYNFNVIIPPYLLNSGSYLVDAWLGLSGVEMVGKFQENVIGFSVSANEIDIIKKELPGLLRPRLEYQIEKQI
jgi:lipopolysaccharide transport system ATP-binding protein